MMEDPVIRSIEATGYPYWMREKELRCPICGKEFEHLYLRGRTTVGCDRCIDIKYEWEIDDEDEI